MLIQRILEMHLVAPLACFFLQVWESQIYLVTKYKFKIGFFFFSIAHCDLKVSHSQAKIYENFANYFFKIKAVISSDTMYM